MRRTRIKFCGMKDADDACYAARLGVDAIGLVFVDRSPRYLGVTQAQAIIAVLPPLVSVVGLFMDDSTEYVNHVCQNVALDCLQFHGNESDTFCASFDRPYLKAIAMNGESNVEAAFERYPQASAFVLDGHVPGEQGGQGVRFDWSRVPSTSTDSVMLAGGLDASNVGQAIKRVQPWAVDVSSGIETAPGKKDKGKMRAFIEAVQAELMTTH